MNQCTLSQQKEIIDIIQYKFILNRETTIKDLESEISENVIKDFKFTEFKDNSEITKELIKNGINIEELFDTDSSSTIYKSNVVKNISTYSIDDLFKGIPVAKKYFDSYLGEIIVREAIIGRGDSDHYVDSDHELSENFSNLKNKLFIEIQEFLQSEGLLSTDVVELFENDRIIDYAYYNHIMGLVSDYFFSGENVGLLTFEGKLVPNLNIDLDSKEHLFKAYNNTILLTNFDSIINTEFKGMIEINYNYFNHLNNSIGRNPKYRIKVKANSLLYWNRDNHDSKNSENKEDQITKMVVNSIPAYNKNNQKLPESMEMKDLYLLGSMIHSFELKYGNKFKNNDVEFEYFNKNPGQSLVWYLQKIIQAFNKEGDYIPEFNDSLKIGERGGFNFRDVINLAYSLNNYINDPELNILAKEKTSTNSLLSIIGQVINNNFGVIYSVFNTSTGLEVQNMHQQDFNSTYINNTVLSYMVTNALNKDMYDLKNKEELDKFNGIFDAAFEEDRNQDIYIYSLNNPSIVEEFSEYISEKTGIPFSNFSFVDLINEMKTQHNKTRIEVSFFKNKVSEFINSINKDFKNKTFKSYITKATSLTSGKVLNNTVSNAFYKSLSKTYLMNFITKPVMNLTTQLGSKVPSFRTSTLTFKDTEIFDLQRTYEKTEGTSYRSLLLKDSSAILGTSTKLEVTNPLTEDEYNSVKDAAKLTPQESFIADFRYEFWDSLMKQDTFQIILGNYSDKNTVFTKIINGRFQLEGSNKIIIQEDMDVLLETVRTQAFKYYSDTFKKVFEDYKELFSKTGFENEANQITDDFENNIKVINNILLRNNIIDLLSIYAELPFSLKNPNLTITQELHYSNYSGGTSINQLLADNYRIFGNINLFNEFVSIQEQSFMDKTVSNQNNTLNHMNSAKGDFNQIASKLGLNFDEFSDEFDKIQLKSGKLNPIVRKWMWLNALFRNEYTFMTSKGEYMHPHKNNSTFRSGEFNEDYWAKYSLEMSGRLDSMAKRNVIFTASIESPVRNSKYGTTEKVNIAAIQDSKAQVYTSSGHKKYNQDAYDGSSYIEDLHSRMLAASFPGKGYGGTMKQFGTIITPYSVTLKKDAETVLTNDRIRNSHSSTNSLLNKKKQMLSIPLNDIIFNDDVLRFEDLYINHLGKQYQIYRVELTNESGQNKLKLFNSLVEDSDKLDQPILEVNVNTLYDIWDAFGGIYSIDEKGNFNEKSNEALYNIVTETNDGKLKNKLIHILSNVSSLKAGATNINSSARWQDSKPLLYSSYDNRFMGPQLDASHGIDNSEIKEVTQLVSALAQGGFTSEVAQEAYEDIANVIKTSAQPYLNSMKADDKKLYYYLTDKFIETINNAKGESIAKTLIHSIKEDGINIPFSNNNFFGLFVRDVVTRLNNEFISRHYSGIGSVLIPSHGIFQVYDRVLPDGRTIVMTQADLIKEALQEYDSIEFERIYGRQPVNNEEIIEFYKSTILVDLPVNIGEIEVGDTVLINGQNLSLSTPEEYYRFKRSYQQDTVIKVYSKPRDLKPTSHTFKVNGQQRNIFDFKSLELLYKNKEIIDSLNKGEQIVIDSSVILLNDFSNYISHKNNKSFDLLNNLNKNSIEVLKALEKYLRQWVQRDFELLHEGLAMTNHISNFSEYFGNDNFTDVLSDVIENYRLHAQPVTDVVFKSAEKVVGDIYQTNFGRDLNDSMYEINKKGALFFKEKLLKYYGKDNVEADLKIISDKSDKPIYIKYVDELGLLDRTINIKSSIKSEDDLKRTYIRYNELGEEIYSFTDSDNVRVSTDEDGNEIIYVRFGKKYNDDRKRIYGHHKTKSFEKNVKGIIKSFKGSIKAVVPLMNRDARTTSFFSYDENGIIPKGNYNFNFGEFTTEVFKNFTGIEVLEDHIYSSNWFERNKDNILDRMSNSMYISWQKSHELIDARIPGQSMQSFMPMKNIAYMNTTTNDSYVSITQVFLQGSDFDIDKAYTLGSGFTSNGRLNLWTNLSEYSSIEQLNELEKLPLPTNRQITLANPDITEELNLEEVENINATEDYNDIVESIAIYGETMNTNYQFPAETIKLFNKFLRKYNHLDRIVITSVSNRLSREKFINLINAHNLDSSFRNKEGVVKNSVVSRIKQIISDPRNQILANTPVTVQDWHDAIKIVEDRKSQTLINSSHSGNVKVAGREGIPKFMDSKRNRNYKAMKEYAIKNGYIYTLREQGNEHFGNPYSNMKVKGTIPTKSTKESVEKFIDWILYNPDEIQEDRRQWILTQLRNGSLKNKPLLYYKDLREPSHANALDYLINQFDWSNKTNIESLQNRAINNASKNNIVLTPEQNQAKSEILNFFNSNPNGKYSLIGSAGTGKTTLIRELKKEFEGQEIDVVFSTPTHRANTVISSKDPLANVMTLHSLLGLSPDVDLENFDSKNVKFSRGDSGPKINSDSVLIIDESSMINDSLFDFINSTLSENKIIYVGDSAQLKPVKSETLSKALTSTEGTSTLTTVMRTDSPALLNESVNVRNTGDFSFESNVENNKGIIFTNNESSFLSTAADAFRSEDFKNNPLYARVLAYSNKSVASYNNQIREMLFGNDAEEFIVGEPLFGYANLIKDQQGGYGINNGIDYKILKSSPHNKLIPGTDVALSGYNLQIQDVFDKETKNIFIVSKNESQTNIDFFKNVLLDILNKAKRAKFRSAEYGAFWGQYYRLQNSFIFTKDIKYTDEWGRERGLINKGLDYGYAHTIHKSQGGTYNYTFVSDIGISSQDSDLSSQLRYVGITRSENISTVYSPRANSDDTNLMSLLSETSEQIPEEIDEKSNVINSLYTNHSGGAEGSDSYWDYIGRTHGLKNHRHYFIQGFNTPKGNIGLSSDFIEEATEHVLNANKTLRRQYPTKDAYIDNLLLRNWAQVKNADTVFAIGKLKGNEVEGGTGWAVQMAIDNLKPVFVFDQFKNNWYEYNYELGLFEKSDIPVLTKNFAGIGTREINSLGIQAIKDVYNKTLGTIDYDSTEIYREITKNTEVKNLKGEERPLITESFLETNKKFREIPVIISDDFKGAASFNKKTKTIQINIPLMKQKFEEKAWSKPNTLQDNTKVDPFPEEQFSNFEEWLTFVVLHEYYHSKLERKRFDNGNLEPLNVYENRINEHAFKTLRDTYNTDIANVDESKIEMVTEEKSTKLNNKKLLSSYDMISYYIQQYNASVGKDDVGIAANGVKTLYALSSYYNTYYKNNNFEPDLVNSFKSFNKNFTFLKNGELMSLGGNFTTIADVQMNNVQRKMFEEFDSSFNIKFVNAANNLSGFLSAATDNAKELIMAKVNASTDLASMHIYLMILGLDIDQVVEIMTSDIMEDIINKMDHNVFSTKRKLSFNTVIDELSKTYKNRGDNDSIYNLNTYLNIYKAASELTSLSTLLGINQKRKATTWEIYNYLNTFSKTLVNAERNKIPINILETYKLRKNPEEIIKYIHTISRQTNIEEIVNSAHALGIIGGSFDFERYFAEPSYKQATKEYYNLIKETFNVFDILDEVPHFKEMVNSLVLFHNILKKYSTKYNYIFDLFRDSIGDTNPTEDIIKRGILYNDSRAREEWFKTDKMLNFSFDLKNLMKMAKKDNFTLYTSSSAQKNSEKEKHSVVVDINDDSNPLISLENNEGIANFKNAFEQLLLPILQSNLKNNNFLKLENTINPFGIQTSHVAPTVATSNINVPALVKQFQKALKTFDELDTSFDINYQIKNNLSEFVKWKDIIFVYNLIVNNERYGDKRITPLLQNYMHDKNSLGYDYIKFWSRIDNGLELMNESSETDIKFYVNNKQGIDLTRSLYGDNPDFPIITNVQETEQIKIHNKNINDIIRLIKEGGYIITLKC